MIEQIKRRRGVTAIEILVSVAAFGILFAFTFPILQYFVDRAYSNEAREQLSLIYEGSTNYLIEHPKLPPTVEKLAEAGFLDLNADIDNRWDFSFVQRDGMLYGIRAVSTDVMPKGANKVVEYDLQTGQFKGYGSKIHHIFGSSE